MKRGIFFLIILIFLFSFSVYANEDDLLINDNLEYQEDLKDEKNLFKSVENNNNTKSSDTDPLLAKTIFISLAYGGSAGINIESVDIGKWYKLYIEGIGICGSQTGYFVRGQEYVGQDIYYGNEVVGNIIDLSEDEYSIDSFYYPTDIIDPIPEPTPEPIPNPDTISCNEILKEILKTNKEIAKDVKIINESISNNRVSDSFLSDNTISDNIIQKKLIDYNTNESLTLIFLMIVFCVLIIYIIHKTIFRIRR